MQHDDLDKTKVLKTQRDFMSDVRKPNSNSMLHLWKERSKSLVELEKWLKETRLRVDLVSNSSFLNGDIGITKLVISNFDQ
jgi:hypothetical protein